MLSDLFLAAFNDLIHFFLSINNFSLAFFFVVGLRACCIIGSFAAGTGVEILWLHRDIFLNYKKCGCLKSPPMCIILFGLLAKRQHSREELRVFF